MQSLQTELSISCFVGRVGKTPEWEITGSSPVQDSKLFFGMYGVMDAYHSVTVKVGDRDPYVPPVRNKQTP